MEGKDIKGGSKARRWGKVEHRFLSVAGGVGKEEEQRKMLG